MTDFNEILKELRKISKFAIDDNFENKLSIIRATCKTKKHKMLVEEDFAVLNEIYNALKDLEMADLFDYENFEKELWTIQ